MLLSILTCIYMLSSSGIAMEVHYCMGKQAGVDFYAAGNDTCGRCGMKDKKGGCCRDEHKFYKLNADHKIPAAADFYFHAPAVLTEIPSFSYDRFLATSETLPIAADSSPPDLSLKDICILNCIFLI